MTTDTRTKIKTSTGLKEPNQYKVIYVNDEVTSMEFVVSSLMQVFGFDEPTAEDITMQVHTAGSAVVAVLPYEIAEQKGMEVTMLAREDGYPLQVRIEEDK